MIAQRTIRSSAAVAAVLLLASLQPPAVDAQRAPGRRGSANVDVLSHLPVGGPFHANDLEIEQELSRPYVYLSRRSSFGFHVIDVGDPTDADVIHSWEIENAALHVGRAVDTKYFKWDGRYYLVQAFQFRQAGPDRDLGAIIFDVTGLPDASTVREVARIREPENPGGFHNIFAYKHSDGRALLFATVAGPYANVYDLGRIVEGDVEGGRVARVPIPETGEGRGNRRGYHDFYAGYHPATGTDRFYGGGTGGYYVYDITDLESPELLTSLTGISGVRGGHTITPDPTGRYIVTETEYQYAPLRIFDLRPGLDGEVATIRNPISAWTADWRNLVHNHEVRWPYVFVSAYEDGLQVFTMIDPENPKTVAYYDTYPGPHEIDKSSPFDPGADPGRGSVLNGAFGVDVRNADGLIVVADMYTGFWAFRMEGFQGWSGESWGVPNVSSAQDWDDGPAGRRAPARTAVSPGSH